VDSNGSRVALAISMATTVFISDLWEGFVTTAKRGTILKALPKKAQKGDLHTVVTGNLDDGSARIQIYLCEQSGDGTRGNRAAWVPFQLGANLQQRE
jgi:hypothetical protein